MLTKGELRADEQALAQDSTDATRSLRLTRRGHAILVIFPLIVLGFVLLFAWGGMLATPAKAGVTKEETTNTVTVQAGESLWSLAQRNGQNRDIRDLVVDIVKLNDLHDGVLQPGQTLRVPKHEG